MARGTGFPRGEVVLSLTRNPSAALHDYSHGIVIDYVSISITLYQEITAITIRRAYISALRRESGLRDHADALYHGFMSDNLPTSESAS